MQLDKYLVAFVVLGLVVTVGLLMMGDVNTHYGTNLSDADFNEGNFSGLVENMYADSSVMKDKTVAGRVEDENFLTTLVKGAYRAVKQVTNSFSIVVIGMENIASVLGLPAIFAKAVYAVVVLMVIFALIYLYMKISVS